MNADASELRRTRSALLLVALAGLGAIPLAAQQMATTTRDPHQTQDAEFSAKYREWTGAAKYGSPLVDHLPVVKGIPSPRDVLGYDIGAPKKLTYYVDMLKYYRALAKATPRVRVETIGKSDEGRELVVVWVSSDENMKRLQQNRTNLGKLADPRGLSDEQIQALIAGTKPQYHLFGGLHSGETGPSEMLMELVYRLATETSPLITQIRNNVYVSITPAADADGRDRNVDWFYHGLDIDSMLKADSAAKRTDSTAANGAGRGGRGGAGATAFGGRGGGSGAGALPYWGKYVYHDNNRDINLSLLQMRAIADWYFTAHPPIMHDLHESESLMYDYSGGPPQNPNLDPILFSELPWFANFEMAQMTKWGMPGVYDFAFMDGWSPGYLGSIAYNHNGMMKMYETQSGRDVDTAAARRDSVAAAGRGRGRGGNAGNTDTTGGRAGAARGTANAGATGGGRSGNLDSAGRGGRGGRGGNPDSAGRGGRSGNPDSAGRGGRGGNPELSVRTSQFESATITIPGGRGAGPAGRGGAPGGGRESAPPSGKGGSQDREWYRGLPIPPDAIANFTRRDNTNYMETGVLSALQLTAAFPNVVVQNFYIKTRNSIDDWRTHGPAAYVIPVQRDMTRAAQLVDVLRIQGIEVGIATQAVTVGDSTYAAGSFIITRNQPYGRLIKNLLEKQIFPDPRLTTYDDSGWSMGLEMLVDVVPATDSAILRAPTTAVTWAKAPGTVRGTGSAGIAVADYGSNNMITFRYRFRSIPMKIAESAFTADGVAMPAGSFVISGTGDAPAIRAVVDSLGLTAAALDTLPSVPMHDANVPRVAIYSQWNSTQDLGWYRLTFDNFHVPYDLIFKERVAQGDLRKDYDVILMADQNINKQTVMQKAAAHPQPYEKSDKYQFLGMYGSTPDMSGGFGQKGVDAFQQFLDQGGTLIAIGQAVRFPIDFGWAHTVDTSRVEGLTSQNPIVAGEIARRDSPVFYGYDKAMVPVKYVGGATLRVGTADEGNVVARYAGGDASVLSGLMVGADALKGRPFAVDVPGAYNGHGHVVLFTNNPIYRWQNHGEFNMVFNVVMNWDDER
ncbi:MAG TPA: M14 family zinc carboxypeptidase [Gemmatimonadales bacterium]